ncbi:glycosyltransferase family 4 protein [Elizabethkingia ursingii]|uniref:glycosyltransferase family 4 protein n=1 Tax=Elizabethkingia ursingii TaxID=1756150 RepID=UPI002011D4FB|nr:glycosyltransferase family 4 protein [Elizabethkingia ursingii]MCL1669430.1 glycosyltransferase family 4 protein [Elizabethkingia ursingii]
MANYKSITFFYPSKIIGGAEFLFFRLAKRLVQEQNININYVDFEDGVVAKMILDDKIKINLIKYTGFSKIKLKDETILVTPLSSAFELCDYFDGNFKVLFWSIHPTGLENAISNNVKYSLIKKTWDEYGENLDRILLKNGVVFMDGPNLNYQRSKFNFTNAVGDFLPIFCPERNGIKKQTEGNIICLGWIGRLSNDKIYSLINAIQHAIEYCIINAELKIKFHIVGNGDQKWRIEKLVLPTNLEIIFAETLVGDELSSYINENVDVFFAMGTSALETSSMHKPTILVDLSFSEIPTTNKFRWIFQSINFSVGDLYDNLAYRNISFAEIINSIQNNNHYEIGDSCYDYYIKNHSLEKVEKKFLNKLENVELYLIDLKSTIFNNSNIFKFLKFSKRFLKQKI